MKTKFGRADKIRAILVRAKAPLTISEIVDGIGETAKQTKFVASTLIRLCEKRELKRKRSEYGFMYFVA
jgi:predicted transcriptional regulator